MHINILLTQNVDIGGWSKVQGHHAYSSLGKAFEKQTKTIEDQGEKQKQLKSV